MLGTKCKKRDCPRYADAGEKEMCVLAVAGGKARYIRIEEVTEKMCKQLRIKKETK